MWPISVIIKVITQSGHPDNITHCMDRRKILKKQFSTRAFRQDFPRRLPENFKLIEPFSLLLLKNGYCQANLTFQGSWLWRLPLIWELLRMNEDTRPKFLFILFFRCRPRVARFFLVQYTKPGKNIPKDNKITQCNLNIPYGCKIFQKHIKYTNLFQYKVLQNFGSFWSEKKPSGSPVPTVRPWCGANTCEKKVLKPKAGQICRPLKKTLNQGRRFDTMHCEQGDQDPYSETCT
jgi:hypothetical protein